MWATMLWAASALALIAAVGVVLAPAGGQQPLRKAADASSYTPADASQYAPATPVPGQNYELCDTKTPYLTSPWTYDVLASGSQGYTVVQYEALPGYGTTLPPLPAYIAGEPPATEAAIIYAPGANVNIQAYELPETPILSFFEGGSYPGTGTGPGISEQSVSGDEFIGGQTPGWPEPKFNDDGYAGGISDTNSTYSFSGGTTALASSAPAGALSVTTAAPLAANSSWITFADGPTYKIASSSGTSVVLAAPLATAEKSGSQVWSNSIGPIGEVSASAARGATSVTISKLSNPLVQYSAVAIGTDTYGLTSVSGSESAGYTVGVAGLDAPVAADTPVYYNAPAGDVAVEYLEITNDLHTTTGTLALGSGWTVEHDNILDSYEDPGEGFGLYGGDYATVEYNCFGRLGSYLRGSGANSMFAYNEVEQTAYDADPNCGCSGGGKWWGTLNASIIDNAFVDDGIGGQSAVWLDDGDSGTLIQGNYFYDDAGVAVEAETSYDVEITDNLFLDDGWGTGSGQSANNDGAVDINTSGGIDVPGSRYENEILISGNQFINDWQGVGIWQSTLRSCLSSGEGWPDDSAYCSGGFPVTDSTSARGQYYFSHTGDTAHGGAATVAQPVPAGGSTVYVVGPEAIDDQVGFTDPASTTTTSTTNVTAFTGSGVIHVTSTSGFPSSGQLRVDTSAAGGGGGYTGAVLSYAGTTATSFTGVWLVRGTGTLTGAVLQVQPYKVTAEKCYANDCALTVSPPVASPVAAGTEAANTGTCALYAISTALPSGPLAPNGVSYWDGCQWQARNISVTGNTFTFQPGVISASVPPEGTATSNQCTPANNCGLNFMAFQAGGTAPISDMTGGNAMMSDASFTGCPGWDPGCTASPLKNINALPSPPGAPPGNGEAPYNNDWSGNAYSGPWTFFAYNWGPCWPLPADPVTGNTMPQSDCGIIPFSAWQSGWQQDATSTYTPVSCYPYGPCPPSDPAAEPASRRGQ
jgi:hypothetical protein